MDYLIIGAQLLLSLSILVVLHELGHFIPAKLFKTKVEKFYLFFNPWFSLFKIKKGETEYGIGWLPLGGFVKIAGMIDESMDTDQMKGEPQPWEFRSKPAWQRLIIMIGGITVNMIVGVVIYGFVVFGWGTDFVKKDGVVNGFSIHPTMEQYGLRDGDKIVKVNGEEFKNALNINKYLLLRAVETIEVEHLNGTIETIKLPADIGSTLFQSGAFETAMVPRTINLPVDTVLENSKASSVGIFKGDYIDAINDKKLVYYNDLSKTIYKNYKKGNNKVDLSIIRANDTIKKTIFVDSTMKIGLGTMGDPNAIAYTHQDYSFMQAIPKGASLTWWTLRDYVSQFKFVFTKKGASQLSGFGGMAKLFNPTWDWKRFWLNTALISIILAFMNFLPIPALDGGYILFLLFEIVSGKRPSDSFLEKANTFGFFILLGLLVLANGNDIFGWLK